MNAWGDKHACKVGALRPQQALALPVDPEQRSVQGMWGLPRARLQLQFRMSHVAIIFAGRHLS